MQLVNGLGIATHFDVSISAVSNWRARNADYPLPLEVPGVIGVPIWDLDDIIRWRSKSLTPSL